MLTQTNIYLCGHDLTYQYNPEGEIATSAGSGLHISVRRVPGDLKPSYHDHYDPIVDSIDDIPPCYKNLILDRWGEQGWKRLQYFTQAILDKRPENPSVQEQAWIAGLHPDGGEYIANLRQRYAASKAEVEAEIACSTAKQDRIDELKTLLQPQVLRTQESKNPEGGVDYRAEVEICGAVYICRDLFDAGYVIHPPDGKGVATEGTWWSLDDERLMTAAELLAVEYLRLCPPIYSGINM